MESSAKVEPGPGKHGVYTHFPEEFRYLLEDENNEGFFQKTCWYSRAQSGTFFGDLITADHTILSEESESLNNHRYAVVVQDMATQWVQSYPCETKNFQETQKSLQKFLEPNRKPKVIYTDNSLEFGKSCEDLSWNHCTSTPHGSETNGIAERALRRIKEWTSAVLLQSGLDEKWWADSMECYTAICETFKTSCLMGKHLTNDVLENHLKDRSIIPFGSLVEYYSFFCERPVAITSMWPKSLARYTPRLCIVCGVNLERRRNGRRHWRIGGDGRIRTRRQKAQCKGSVNADERWQFYLPCRRWKSQSLWRRLTSENIHFNQGSSRTRRGTSSSRRIRRTLFSNPSSRRLYTGWCGS